MVWVGRPDGIIVHPNPQEQLPLVAFESPCAFRDPAIGALDRAGIRWRIAFSSPSLSALWAATEAGLGITVRTGVAVPRDLVVLDPVATGLPPLPRATLTLVQAEREQPAAVAFLQDVLLRCVCEEIRTTCPDGWHAAPDRDGVHENVAVTAIARL